MADSPRNEPPAAAATAATGGPAERRRTPAFAALCVLVLLPLALRLAPIRHGLPQTTYVPDAHMVRGALGMAKDKTLVPPSGAYTSYPYLLPYMLLPVYGAQYAAGRATGEWGGAGEYGMRLLEEPGRAHLPARLLVALFGALTPWVAFRLARTLGQGAGAWVAAWLSGTGLLHVHFSVQERPWVPMTFFILLSCWGAAAHLAGRRRALFGAWVAAALAFATHQGGLFAVGIPGLAWLVSSGRVGFDAGERSIAARAKALGIGLAVFVAVALLVGHPYYLVHGAADASEVSGGLGGEIQVGGQGFSYRFRLESTLRMVRAFFGYDPALMLLGAVGFGLALARRAAWPTCAFALVWGGVFLTNFNDHVRYLLPLAVVLTPLAGFAGDALLRLRLPAARFALIALLALPAVQAARLGQVLARPDTRAEAIARLTAEAAPGRRVALDVYGPDAPLDLTSLERLSGWRELYGREENRRMLLEAGVETAGGPGLDAVRIEDLFEFDARTHGSRVRPGAAHLGADANAVLAELGVTHVLLVDRDPGDDAPPFLLDETPAADGAAQMAPLRVEPEPEWILDPARPGATALEARLPTELEMPLLSLWQVTRPGPRLALHRLAR